VIERLACERSVLVSIEDCLTLEVGAYTLGELTAMGLRPLRATRPPTVPVSAETPPGELTALR
jgi:hypothetical protein